MPKRLTLVGLIVLVVTSVYHSNAFSPLTLPPGRQASFHLNHWRRRQQQSRVQASSSSSSNCECDSGSSADTVLISGSPSDEARNINIQEALSKSTVFRLDGSAVSVSSLFVTEGVSIVVLTRSFGWPFCQEQILQYSLKRELLQENGVHLSLISIGKPEIGMALCKHLNIQNGEEWIFADPTNDAYDRLKLNRGWGTMIRPATALRFRDRIFGSGDDGKQQGSMDQVSYW